MPKTPTKNLFWDDLTPDCIVEETDTLFIAHLPNGSRAVIYWEGQHARGAQMKLKIRAAKDKSRLDELKKTKLLPFFNYDDYKGGKNNLIVCKLLRPNSHGSCNLRNDCVAVGTSVVSKKKAEENARRNFKRMTLSKGTKS